MTHGIAALQDLLGLCILLYYIRLEGDEVFTLL